MNNAVISLGANKGKSIYNLKKSLSLLDANPYTHLSAVSSIYKTAPVYDEDQSSFYNAAASFSTSLSEEEFFALMQDVEQRIGKEKEREKGPRRIDLDLLFFNNEVIKKNHFTVPHPSISERLFVLKPLMEIIPFYIHPVHKKSIRDLYFQCESDKMVEYKMSFNIKKKKKTGRSPHASAWGMDTAHGSVR